MATEGNHTHELNAEQAPETLQRTKHLVQHVDAMAREIQISRLGVFDFDSLTPEQQEAVSAVLLGHQDAMRREQKRHIETLAGIDEDARQAMRRALNADGGAE